jgi:hypothetical protein
MRRLLDPAKIAPFKDLDFNIKGIGTLIYPTINGRLELSKILRLISKQTYVPISFLLSGATLGEIAMQNGRRCGGSGFL